MSGFIETQHLINLDSAPWRQLHDEWGHVLDDIRGKAGACGDSLAGCVGLDLIEMAAATEFPLHTHPGSHVLFVLEGQGCVSIDGKRYHVRANDSIYIAADLPHAVSAPSQACAFLAFGHPHKQIDSTDRMTIVEVDGEETALG